MNENEINLNEGLEKLINDAKKNKNVIEYGSIGRYFDTQLREEDYEYILDELSKKNIDVLTIPEKEIEGIENIKDEELFIDDMDEVEEIEELEEIEEEVIDLENIDLSVPDGVSIDDPVRMYLRENIGIEVPAEE